jgi:pimeloyl-ACP methyl ester carboxylesterase
MSTVTSADGTSIAYDVWGDGQPLIFVDGATAHRAVNPKPAELAGLPGNEFRVYAYDRRGRGESGDTAPFDVRREIEDLGALIEAAGGSAMVCGFSSGSVLALDAAAAGLPITTLAMFEPPFVVDDGRPPLPADYVKRLDASVADGKRGDAVELFLTAAAGVPAEYVPGMKQSPMWPGLEAVAHTISYDGRVMQDVMRGKPLPTDRWSAVRTPVLVLYGRGTAPWLVSAAKALGELLPTATVQEVDGEQHDVAADVLASVLRDFAKA